MDNAVQQLILCQDRLYAYILALMGDPVTTEDVLQETNLAATERMAETASIGDFAAWLFGVARNQVQTYRRRQARERLRFKRQKKRQKGSGLIVWWSASGAEGAFELQCSCGAPRPAFAAEGRAPLHASTQCRQFRVRLGPRHMRQPVAAPGNRTFAEPGGALRLAVDRQ